MGDCRKMQHAVRGTAERHVYRQCIQNGVFCHNIPWTDILAVHLHNGHARMLCKLDPFRVNCGNRTVAPQAHAQRLCQTVHGIGRVHAGTGAAGRTCFRFIFSDVFFRHSPCRIRTDCLKHGR